MKLTLIKLISSILMGYIAYSTLSEPFIELLPDGPGKLIRLTLPVLGGLFCGWVLISSLSTAFIGTTTSPNQTHKIDGIITSISYSSFRINNKPRFKVGISYLNIEKIFDPIHSDIQLNFSIGDTVIIQYNPKNIKDSSIDLEESMKTKSINLH